MHLVTIPVTKLHTVKIMFAVVSKVLQFVMGKKCNTELISFAPESAANNSGEYLGATLSFDKACLSGFHHIWCEVHQVGFIFHNCRSTVVKQSFRDLLMTQISYLCRQVNLKGEMGRRCPTENTTRWFSLNCLKTWILRHRDRIAAYRTKKIYFR